jgi:hypothetical protein
MVAGIMNGWRFEDFRLDREPPRRRFRSRCGSRADLAASIRTSPTAGHGMREAIVSGTASKYWRCLKVKAVGWVWDPRGIGKPVLPIGRSRTDQTLKTKRTSEAWVPIERALLLFWIAIHRTAGPHRVTTSPTARNICGAVVLSHGAIATAGGKKRVERKPACPARTIIRKDLLTRKTKAKFAQEKSYETIR